MSDMYFKICSVYLLKHTKEEIILKKSISSDRARSTKCKYIHLISISEYIYLTYC